MKTLLIAATLAATILGGAFAATDQTKPKATQAVLVCPVTGEKIASIQVAAGHSTYKGKTYYFCCGGCKPMFDQDPAKYVHPTAATK